MEKSRILFIRAKQKKDYVFDGIRKMGYDIVIPYCDRNLFLRCMREVWFKFKLPGESLWFNRKIKNCGYDFIIIKDPLIVPNFLTWVRKYNPNARIILTYDNRVSDRLSPADVDDSIEMWSYCINDCEEYGLRLSPPAYLDCYAPNGDNADVEYDILYLGRDKGRFSQLQDIEKTFKDSGLSTLFYICADRSFRRWKNKNYKPFIPYEEYLRLLRKSRATLNIMPPQQRGITQRELEAVFDNKKCITTNHSIKQFPLYDPRRFFILGEDLLDDINQFLLVPLEPISPDVLREYCFDSFVDYILQKTDDYSERKK